MKIWGGMLTNRPELLQGQHKKKTSSAPTGSYERRENSPGVHVRESLTVMKDGETWFYVRC